MVQNKTISLVLLILFSLSSFFLISSSAQSSSKVVQTKKCKIGGTQTDPGLKYFKVRISGSYVGNRFVLKKVKYAFGPGSAYNLENKFFIYYRKPNNKRDQWNSPRDLQTTGGAMRGFKNFKKISIKKDSRINIRGYVDEALCVNSFKV